MVAGGLLALRLFDGGTSDPQNRTDSSSELGPEPTRPVRENMPSLPVAPSTAASSGSDDFVACVEGRTCKEGSSCVRGEDGSVRCIPSDCHQHGAPCPAGRTCRIVALAPKAFRCIPDGIVGVEGACTDRFPAPAEFSCGSNLICWHGRCRTPCEANTDCGQGEKCAQKSSVERVCAGDLCDSDGDCPPHRPICLDIKDSGASSCFSQAEGSCRPGSCPKGQVCDAQIEGNEIRGQCKPGCDLSKGGHCQSAHTCAPPKGIVSERAMSSSGVCYRVCSLATPTVCGKGELCMTLGTAAGTWGCVSAPGSFRFVGLR